MSYQVIFSKGAARQFKKLPQNIQERIQIKIDDLAIEPRPNGVKKLEGEDSLYRIRVGDYRVVYEILDDILLVTVLKVKHRSSVYRDES
ncbi:MAG: type II toxin-antitoxin system RelE/ParE family toxin [Nostocaceae cyanobacterium]|nr:type II toxin-antitoxin system RelE/ParE family toxin [Rivularia sp. ALOHA_DT_140]MDJ0733223.1 type II toxin-antitoxin system RelE/ParE family toxin [Nostocaceae cyanobacterium]